VTFKKTSIEKFCGQWRGNRAFDLVICSHVLQHVNTASVAEIMRSLAKLAQKDGRIMVTTCFSNKTNDEFIACEWANDEAQIERQIGEGEFNQRVSANSLAVHRFTLNTIYQLCRQAGLKIVDLGVFHLFEGEQPWKITMSDKLVLDSLALDCPPLRGFALDLLVVLERME
jgi:2-polyprenyl-3-methyl-5-hydroxy-6-metoxy-1,4-benzoquinol methylase